MYFPGNLLLNFLLECNGSGAVKVIRFKMVDTKVHLYTEDSGRSYCSDNRGMMLSDKDIRPRCPSATWQFYPGFRCLIKKQVFCSQPLYSETCQLGRHRLLTQGEKPQQEPDVDPRSRIMMFGGVNHL